MKKILLILTVVALTPLATQAENLLNTDEAFQVARAFKLGRESSSTLGSGANMGGSGNGNGWYGQKKGKMKQVHIVCPDYKYYRQKDVNGNAAQPAQCTSICADIECKAGTSISLQKDRCCCVESDN